MPHMGINGNDIVRAQGDASIRHGDRITGTASQVVPHLTPL